MEKEVEIISQADPGQKIEDIVNLWKMTTPKSNRRQFELAESTDPRLLDPEVITLILAYIRLTQSSLLPAERRQALEELEQGMKEEINRRRPTLNRGQITANRKLFQEGKISFTELTERNKKLFQIFPPDPRYLSNLNALSFVHHDLINDLAETKTAFQQPAQKTAFEKGFLS